MKEFEDISHSGGKVTFHKGQQKYEMRNPYPVVLYELLCSLNGCLLGRGNFGQRAREPQPSFTLMIMSDKEGFFGFNCPKCNKYFRSNLPHEKIFCTYCLYFGESLEFFTKNQKQYLELYYQKILESLQTEEEIYLELDDLISKLDNNIIQLNAYEERQQQIIECKPCKIKFDVLGIYASCPVCGVRNYIPYFTTQITNIKNSNNASKLKLKEVVELYSGLGADIKNLLIENIPLTDKCKQKLRNLDFQNLNEANELMKNMFEIKLFSNDSANSLNLFFQRRHIIVHNSSIADQKYMDRTQDKTYRLGQKIKLDDIELNKFISELKTQTINMLSELNTIWVDYAKKHSQKTS